MKKVLITGGTGALGQELIKALSSQNLYKIFFTFANSEEKAKELEKIFGVKAIRVIDGDISNLNDDFDIVINNAGFGGFGGLTDTVDDELLRKTFEINVMLPFKICKKVLPKMVKNNWGRIVNVSSLLGLNAGEYTVAYNTTKFALNGMTRTIAREYAKYNITCNAVCPSAIGEEGMAIDAARFYSEDEKGFNSEIKAYETSTPIGRMSKVSEVANVILFLLSEQASYINGVCLPIDGGKLA